MQDTKTIQLPSGGEAVAVYVQYVWVVFLKIKHTSTTASVKYGCRDSFHLDFLPIFVAFRVTHLTTNRFTASFSIRVLSLSL